jgi:hypothetical protein
MCPTKKSSQNENISTLDNNEYWGKMEKNNTIC